MGNETLATSGEVAKAADSANAAHAVAAAPVVEQPYLAFRLAGEVYAVGILRVREIIAYTPLTSVPMMPASVRGVINLRGSVVPVIDLAVRFGRPSVAVGQRTCFVIVEVEHEGATHILGLMVDGVNAVMEIAASEIEPAPAFGTRVQTDFIAGIARVGGIFVIILDIGRVLSIEEMAVIKSGDLLE
ncbi:chemotaxis protein CheW [Rhodocyclus tenuis]|uniref:chemotaxis protein CheW n=1 Tax=Rhodocyclus tenuis TaxID=1066 RepID=UPI001908FBF0|nr:chemotaxis protein CheW [Rhodocyclus tenuis]MBK1680492.1 chemotaxis protein CheW [Rhodocyclus tenuis]